MPELEVESDGDLSACAAREVDVVVNGGVQINKLPLPPQASADVNRAVTTPCTLTIARTGREDDHDDESDDDSPNFLALPNTVALCVHTFGIMSGLHPVEHAAYVDNVDGEGNLTALQEIRKCLLAIYYCYCPFTTPVRRVYVPRANLQQAQDFCNSYRRMMPFRVVCADTLYEVIGDVCVTRPEASRVAWAVKRADLEHEWLPHSTGRATGPLCIVSALHPLR